MKKQIMFSIMVATVMVAGIFAFLPIENAATVHDTVQATQKTLQVDTFDASAIDLTDGQEIEVTSAAAFCLVDITIEYANLDANDRIDTTDFQINDITPLEDLVFVLITIYNPQGGFDGTNTLFTSIVSQISDQRGIAEPYCVEADGTMDFVLDDGAGGAGDLIVGEIIEIVAFAIVDGNVPITVTLGEAD